MMEDGAAYLDLAYRMTLSIFAATKFVLSDSGWRVAATVTIHTDVGRRATAVTALWRRSSSVRDLRGEF